MKSIVVGVVVLGAICMVLFLPSYFVSRIRSSVAEPRSYVHVNLLNLNQIASACHMYAADHAGFYPPDFSYLFDKYLDNPEVLVAKGETDRIGEMSDAMEWTSFVYVRGRTADSPPDAVLAFLPPGYHKNDLGYIAFLDHVTSMPLREFTRTLNRQLVME